MKIAICFSGQIRTGAISAPNLIRFIGDLMPYCDFFMHTWDISENKPWHFQSLKVKELGQNAVVRTSTYDLLKDFVNAYPKKFSLVEIETFETWFNDFIKTHLHFSPLWYSWNRSIKLKHQHEQQYNFKYDYVIKIRPDIIFPKNYSLQQEIDYIKATDPTNFYAMGYSPIRIDDVFFISNSELMDQSSKFIEDVTTYEWTTNIFGEYLQTKNIECKNTRYTEYSIYRKETMGIHPLQYNRCKNVDLDHYSPDIHTYRYPNAEIES